MDVGDRMVHLKNIWQKRDLSETLLGLNIKDDLLCGHREQNWSRKWRCKDILGDTIFEFHTENKMHVVLPYEGAAWSLKKQQTKSMLILQGELSLTQKPEPGWRTVASAESSLEKKKIGSQWNTRLYEDWISLLSLFSL